ncbi:MAG: rutC family domain protein [Massilia sp.]|jgi:enamine deaminase RidA (YjgF/YER057c/UK114 family)|nr:rutC family domain protein [Massilia sp.]MDB5948485.1 rutC family domain protein [Massilia sp.]
MQAFPKFTRMAAAATTLALLQLATAAQADEIKRTGSPSSQIPLSTTVSVPAGSRIVFFSGHLADVANPAAPKGSIEAYGNTTTQTMSILKKFEKLLAAEGLTLGDVVKVNVFMAGDPDLGGKMDFAGLNAAYVQYFGTAAQPNKPVRTALQVAALPMPGGLVEIEMTAAKALTK